MISDSGWRLASLTDDELIGLLRVLPGLAGSWAAAAGTDLGQLHRGRQVALDALRAAMTHRDAEFLSSLARTGLAYLATRVRTAVPRSF
jgi:hypothetical protein